MVVEDLVEALWTRELDAERPGRRDSPGRTGCPRYVSASSKSSWPKRCISSAQWSMLNWMRSDSVRIFVCRRGFMYAAMSCLNSLSRTVNSGSNQTFGSGQSAGSMSMIVAPEIGHDVERLLGHEVQFRDGEVVLLEVQAIHPDAGTLERSASKELRVVLGSLRPLTAPNGVRIALSISAASVTVRVIGPAVSCEWAIGMIPFCATSPSVGFSPTTPLLPAGQRMEPSVSDSDGRGAQVGGRSDRRTRAGPARVPVEDIRVSGEAAATAPAIGEPGRDEACGSWPIPIGWPCRG